MPRARSLGAASRGARLAGLACLACLACDAAGADPARTETPAAPMVLAQVVFEERQEGQVVWQGTARSGAGDLARLEVQDLQLLRKPQAPGEAPLQLTTPLAQLDLQAREGVFAPVVVTLADGTQLHAPSAHYAEARGTLEVAGPVTVDGPLGQLSASAATVYFDDGRIEVGGPIIGLSRGPPLPGL